MSTLRKYLGVSVITSLSAIPSQVITMNLDIFHLPYYGIGYFLPYSLKDLSVLSLFSHPH